MNLPVERKSDILQQEIFTSMNFHTTHDCGDKEKTIGVGEKTRGGRQGEQCSSNKTGLKCSHAKDGGSGDFHFPNAAKLVSLFP